MFSLLSGWWTYFFSKPNLHVLLIGLDHAGKTTILEALKTKFTKQHGLPPEKIPPTIGMNLAKIFYHGTQVIIWDLGGQIKMRSMWEKYYAEAHVVIFVVDSANVVRLEEAKLAYDATCSHNALSHIPVITFANKQDLSVNRKMVFNRRTVITISFILQEALTATDLAMNFHPIQDAAETTRVFPISALTG